MCPVLSLNGFSKCLCAVKTSKQSDFVDIEKGNDMAGKMDRIRAVAVYCGSRSASDPAFDEAAATLKADPTLTDEKNAMMKKIINAKSRINA